LHVRSSGLDSSKTSMTEHEEVIAWRRRAIFGGIDFFVGSVHANAQHFHKDATAIRDLVECGPVEFGKVHTARHAGPHGDGLHGCWLGVWVQCNGGLGFDMNSLLCAWVMHWR